MTFKQLTLSACALLLTVSCATTDQPPKPDGNFACQDAQKKLKSMKETSPQKSTLQAYYNKRCG